MLRRLRAIWILEWKNAWVYRGDALLRMAMGAATIALSYLLWRAVFAGRVQVEGYTLPEMTTYYLLGRLFYPLTQSDGLLPEYAGEIKSGAYAKYQVRPLSPLGYFFVASLGRMALPLLLTALPLVAAQGLLPGALAPLDWRNVAAALPVLALGTALHLLVQFLLAMTTFRFTDIGFTYTLQHLMVEFLSGAMIPLGLLSGGTWSAYLPFAYWVYHPAQLMLGKSAVSPALATAVLAGWVLAALGLALWVQRRAPQRVEGVGL